MHQCAAGRFRFAPGQIDAHDPITVDCLSQPPAFTNARPVVQPSGSDELLILLFADYKSHSFSYIRVPEKIGLILLSFVQLDVDALIYLAFALIVDDLYFADL